MTFLFILFILAAAAGTSLWVFRSMQKNRCPYCKVSGGGIGSVIPIIPGFIWWCVSCARVLSRSNLAGVLTENEEDEVELEDTLDDDDDEYELE